MVRRTIHVGGLSLPSALAATLLLAGSACNGSGSVSLHFDIPDDPSLQPSDATTLTLISRVGDQAPRATTAMIASDGTVDLGDLPVANDLWLSAEMRTAQQELVGFGRAPGPLVVSATAPVTATIPVRRPFVYVAGAGARLFTADASVPPSGTYQGSVTTQGTASVIADVAGTDLATITATGTLTYVSTATHAASTLPGASLAGAPRDAVATADGKYLVVGHGGGQVSVVDVASGNVALATATGSADRVAVTRAADGTWWGVALIARATADTGCTPSKLLSFPLAHPDQATSVDATVGLSDLGGDVRTGLVALADRCGNRVLRFDPTTGTVDKGSVVMSIPSPTAVAVDDGHVWAIGHARQTTTDPNVPDGVVDAWLTLGQADLAGGTATVDTLDPLVERVLATEVNFPDQDIAQDLHANSVVADDLVVLPGGERLAFTAEASMAGDALVDQAGDVEIPSLDMTTKEYWLIDATALVPAQRVRTSCTLAVGQCDPILCILANWSCMPDVDPSTVGDFTPTGLVALFGAR